MTELYHKHCKTMKKFTIVITCIALFSIGCTNTNSHSSRFAIQGGAAGALAGAVVGNNLHHVHADLASKTGELAFAGGVAGAVIGAVLGNIVDEAAANNSDSN